MNKPLKELLEEKGYYRLGHDLKGIEHCPPEFCGDDYKGYNIKDTIFTEYALKMRNLVADYQAKLVTLGMQYPRNDKDRGIQLAKLYPQLLEIAKAKVFDDIDEVVGRILTEREQQ